MRVRRRSRTAIGAPNDRFPFRGRALGSAAFAGRFHASEATSHHRAGGAWRLHAKPAAGGPQKTLIRFATDWQAEAEHGGFYEALATGEYAKRGLDVRIIQGGPTVNVPELVASGAVELGDGSNSFIVMNLANAHAPVKAVAAFMQKDPQVLLAHPDAGINSIADMKGHPILLSDASKTAFWPWLKAALRLHRRPGAQLHLQQRHLHPRTSTRCRRAT